MWKHAKDALPKAGSSIEFIHNGEKLHASVAVGTVYNDENLLIVKMDEINEWRYIEEEAKQS